MTSLFSLFLVMPEDKKDFAGLLADVSSCTRLEYKHLLMEPLIIKGCKLILINSHP